MTETNDPIEELEAKIANAAAVVADLSATLKRMRALQARTLTCRTDDELDDLVRPGIVLHKFPISRAELHRRCGKYPIDVPGGFAFRPDGGDYRISLSRFERHFAQHPPKRRCETKKHVSETV